MSTITFDSLSSVKRLREKGVFTQEQAELIASEIKVSSEVDISHLATKEELKVALAEMKTDIIKWVVGMGFAQMAMVLTLLKLH